MKNHTATHLLHAALHNILGHHATQAGSLNEVEFLRFDFTHFQAVTPEELRAIEQQVNEKIWEAIAVETVETDIDTAKEMGAMALFTKSYQIGRIFKDKASLRRKLLPFEENDIIKLDFLSKQ